MSEILFIANDPCILALIDNLQPLVERRISLESDYNSGIKRIFDRHPAVVFLQNRIGDVTCDKLVNQVKMLLDGEPVPLVLLSDEALMPKVAVSTYEACFDLCLPPDELSWQVQQLLHTLPKIVWKDSGAAAPPLPAGEPSQTVEFTLAASEADFSTQFSWLDNNVGIAGDGDDALNTGGILEALEGNAPTFTSPAPPAELQSDQFPANFLADPFAIEPLPPFEKALQPEPSSVPASGSKPTAAPPEQAFADFHRIERADPTQLFGSMSESRVEPFPSVSRRGEPKRASTGASAAALQSTTSHAKKSPRAAAPTGSVLQPASQAAEATQTGHPAGDVLSRYAAATLGIKEKDTRSYRALIICTLLVLCIASLVLFFRLHKFSGAPEIQSIGAPDSRPAAPHSAPRPPAAQQLPQFIPQVPPDARYAANHPGWERYQADALEYLVYREQGRIRAVQVLSGERGAITLPFFKTCIRVGSGHEQFGIKKTEERGGFLVVTGALQNGGEIVAYKEIPSGEIRGFVLSFPSGPPPAEGPKVTAK
jgi:hypothetical protein